jgi:hypothetical protein
MDKADKQVDINNFFKNKEEVFLFFNPEFKNLVKHSSDELMSMINRPLLDSDHKSELLEVIVSMNSDNEMVNLFNESVETEDFDKINSILDSDFNIIYVDDHYSEIEFTELEDEDLEVYGRLGGYYRDYDNWVDEEEADNYIESSWDEIVKGVKEDMIIQYKLEGIDLMAYLNHSNVTFDGVYLEHLMKNHGDYDDFVNDVRNIISSAEDTAEKQAEDEIVSTVEGLFDMGANKISKDVFLIFLMTNDTYDMETFKEFLESKFNIAVDSSHIYEEIQENKYNYIDVDVKKIVEAYNKKVETLCENDIEDNWEEYRNFELKTNPESSEYYQNTHGEDISNDFERLKEKIYGILKKYTNKTDLFLSDGFRVLRIFTNKINPSNEGVYITFEDKVGSNDYNGYVKIDDLHRYINYNENAASFYDNLWKMMGSLGLDTNKSEFENELVKLKIDYSKADVDNNRIYIELMDKGNGRVDKGMVDVSKIPTYYTNHKLFEEIKRIKKLL